MHPWLPIPFLLGALIGSLISDWAFNQEHGPHTLVIPLVVTGVLMLIEYLVNSGYPYYR